MHTRTRIDIIRRDGEAPTHLCTSPGPLFAPLSLSCEYVPPISFLPTRRILPTPNRAPLGTLNTASHRRCTCILLLRQCAEFVCTHYYYYYYTRPPGNLLWHSPVMRRHRIITRVVKIYRIVLSIHATRGLVIVIIVVPMPRD